MVFSGNLTLCVDARVLSEYREVLARPKFGFDRGKVTAIHDYIGRNGRIVASAPLCLLLPDPDDGLFVELAIAGGAVRTFLSPEISRISPRDHARERKLFRRRIS